MDDATPCTPIVVGAIGGRGNGARHIGSDKGEWTIEVGEVGEPRGATEGLLISVVDGIEEASRSDARIRAREFLLYSRALRFFSSARAISWASFTFLNRIFALAITLLCSTRL